jgi:hypothetical protein
LSKIGKFIKKQLMAIVDKVKENFKSPPPLMKKKLVKNISINEKDGKDVSESIEVSVEVTKETPKIPA